MAAKTVAFRINPKNREDQEIITDELLDVLLDKVVVYADKTIELRWKFSNRSN